MLQRNVAEKTKTHFFLPMVDKMSQTQLVHILFIYKVHV